MSLWRNPRSVETRKIPLNGALVCSRLLEKGQLVDLGFLAVQYGLKCQLPKSIPNQSAYIFNIASTAEDPKRRQKPA